MSLYDRGFISATNLVRHARIQNFFFQREGVRRLFEFARGFRGYFFFVILQSNLKKFESLGANPLPPSGSAHVEDRCTRALIVVSTPHTCSLTRRVLQYALKRVLLFE